MVQGYHIYKDLWDASISEELSCQRKAKNYTDPFAVTVTKDDKLSKDVLQHTCTFVPETFIGTNFHKIVLPHKRKN